MWAAQLYILAWFASIFGKGKKRVTEFSPVDTQSHLLLSSQPLHVYGTTAWTWNVCPSFRTMLAVSKVRIKWRQEVGCRQPQTSIDFQPGLHTLSTSPKAWQSVVLLESPCGVMLGCCHRVQLRNLGSFRGRIIVSQGWLNPADCISMAGQCPKRQYKNNTFLISGRQKA